MTVELRRFVSVLLSSCASFPQCRRCGCSRCRFSPLVSSSQFFVVDFVLAVCGKFLSLDTCREKFILTNSEVFPEAVVVVEQVVGAARGALVCLTVSHVLRKR